MYCAILAAWLVGALCAGCVNSDKARSPVSIAISKFLKLFIVEEYFYMDGVATSTVFAASDRKKMNAFGNSLINTPYLF